MLKKKITIIQEGDHRALNQTWGLLGTWKTFAAALVASKVAFVNWRTFSSHMSLSITQVPPFNFGRCLNFSLPLNTGCEGLFCATVWDYSILKLCKCWEAGFVACGKHSGKFLDSLVLRQTARCWQALYEFLFENWAPQLRVCRCWRLWLTLAFCLATCMRIFGSRTIPVVLLLFMFYSFNPEEKTLQGSTAGQPFLLTGNKDPFWQVRLWFHLKMVDVYKDQPFLRWRKRWSGQEASCLHMLFTLAGVLPHPY